MRLEKVHDHGPGKGGKGRPGVVADLRMQGLLGDDGESVPGLDGNACQRQRDTRKDVDDDLLADRRDLAVAL